MQRKARSNAQKNLTMSAKKTKNNSLKKLKHSLFISIGLFFLINTRCAKGQNKAIIPNQQAAIVTVNVAIDLAKTYQVIDNFGASDAWSCQFVGNWPEAKRSAIADLLFSTELNAGGQPKGIGLSLWRFNIGGGSTQQGELSGIKDDWRRAESFLNADGSYDWQRQSGQLYFLQAAKARSVNQFLGFTNSPPVQFTANGKAYGSSGKPNLNPDKFDAFANFLTNVVKGVQLKTGILFNYISPVNEPQWEWSDGGQEGSFFRNSDIGGITKSLNTALTNQNLQTKITVSDAGQYNFMYSDHGKTETGKQVNAFFSPGQPNYIGDLPRVEKLIAAHSYFTTSPYISAVSTRNEVSNIVSSTTGLRFWQSEYCILGDNVGEIKGEGRDLGINPALYVARTIHIDMVNANATAWQWWTAISAYDYKDGLIYVDKNKTDGNYYASKMLWALGNYSRFIRPGAVRVDVSSTEIAAKSNLLLISSYKDLKTKQLITVIVNSDVNPVKLKLNLKSGTVSDLTSYVTSSNADLKSEKSSLETVINPRTITTLVGTIQ